MEADVADVADAVVVAAEASVLSEAVQHVEVPVVAEGLSMQVWMQVPVVDQDPSALVVEGEDHKGQVAVLLGPELEEEASAGAVPLAEVREEDPPAMASSSILVGEEEGAKQAVHADNKANSARLVN